jgi:hypothetical protein
MKQQTSRFIAIALALGSVAFQTSPDDLVTFKYVAPSGANPYLNTKIGNTNNWVATTMPPSCDGEEEIPCTIQIDRDHTLSGGTLIDADEVSISTFPSPVGPNMYYVSGGTNVVVITNKSLP